MLKQDVQSVEPDLQSIFRLNCDFQIDFSADEAIFFDILLLCYVFIRRDFYTHTPPLKYNQSSFEEQQHYQKHHHQQQKRYSSN